MHALSGFEKTRDSFVLLLLLGYYAEWLFHLRDVWVSSSQMPIVSDISLSLSATRMTRKIANLWRGCDFAGGL